MPELRSSKAVKTGSKEQLTKQREILQAVLRMRKPYRDKSA